MMKKISIQEINRSVGGTLVGEPAIEIIGLAEISEAAAHHLTFIGEKKYIKLWARSSASAAIVNRDFDIEPGSHRALIRVDNADLAMAQALQLFEPEPPECAVGIHSTAIVAPTAQIGEAVSIGAGCYIGPGVVIGDQATLYPHVTIMDESRIGRRTTLWPGTVIRERCTIGSGCIIHPNVTIGADGFGYRPSPVGPGMVKIPQIGTVIIGDNVEIGACTCVDRGKFNATTIGEGTKIDNLVQIAHNCKLGRWCAISGHTAMAGSVTVGDGVIMGGACEIRDHVTIGAGSKLGGGTGVANDLAPGSVVLGKPADDHKLTIKRWAALKQLPDLIKELKKKSFHG